MKTALAFFFLAAAVVCVYATSEPHCAGVTCDPETCPKHECSCGTHKDACGCCDFCNKCANEECHPEHNDQCAEGYSCVKKVIGEDHGNTPGHCEPVEHSSTSHDETHGHASGPDSETPVHDTEHHEEGGEHSHSGGSDSTHHE